MDLLVAPPQTPRTGTARAAQPSRLATPSPTSSQTTSSRCLPSPLSWQTPPPTALPSTARHSTAHGKQQWRVYLWVSSHLHCPVHSYEHTSSTVCLTHPPCLACPLPFSDWLPIELQMGSMHHSLSCLSCPVPTRYMPDAGLYGNSSMYSAGVVTDFAACIAVCDGWGSPSVGGPKPGTYCQWLTVSPCDSATNDCSQPCKQATPLNISCRTQDFRCRKDNGFLLTPRPPGTTC